MSEISTAQQSRVTCYENSQYKNGSKFTLPVFREQQECPVDTGQFDESADWPNLGQVNNYNIEQ